MTATATTAAARPARYASAQIILHRVIFVLFVFNHVLSDEMGRALRVKLEGGVPDQIAASIHPPVGIAIPGLALPRIVLRRGMGAPALPAGPPMLNRIAPAGLMERMRPGRRGAGAKAFRKALGTPFRNGVGKRL